MTKNQKALVLLSGGLDSAVCLATAVQEHGSENVIALNSFYGQKHDKEIQCARQLAEFYNVKYLEIDLSEVMKHSNCSLLKSSTEEVPEGEYAEQKREIDKPVSTYVPFRNGLFASVAASIAVSYEASIVYLGIHQDDVAGDAYPDCSFTFYETMDEAIIYGTGGDVRLEAPFVTCKKADIVKRGLELKVPFEKTWSCYKGGDKPCGKCGTCLDRQKAFEANGVTDPLLKED